MHNFGLYDLNSDQFFLLTCAEKHGLEHERKCARSYLSVRNVNHLGFEYAIFVKFLFSSIPRQYSFAPLPKKKLELQNFQQCCICCYKMFMRILKSRGIGFEN